MADRSGQTIGGIKVLGQFLQAQKLLQHLGDLFLAGISVAGDGHFYFLGFVFGNRDLARQTGGHRYALCPSEFEHRLHVLAEKRCFNGNFVGMVGFNKFDGTLKNHLEFGVMVIVFAQHQFVELDEFHLFADDPDQAETHDGRSGVDTQYDAFVCQFICFFAPMIAIPDKAKQFGVFIIKLLIVIGAFYFIYDQISGNSKLDWQQFQTLVLEKATIPGILFIILFSVANRFLEILKWQNLVALLKPISVFESTKQVLGALTAGIFTPNGLGEYAGKALFFEKAKAKKIIFLNLICNGIQMVLTIIFGTLGLIVLGYYFWATLILLLISGFWILGYFSKNIKVKGYSIQKLWHLINEIPKAIHRRNIILGILRYLVFSHQYYFLFLAFDVALPYPTLMASIAAVYFLASSLPSFQFLDFAVKGSVAVFFFGKLGVNEWIVIFISALMWFLNVVLPVVIGSYFVLTFKLKSKIENVEML